MSAPSAPAAPSSPAAPAQASASSRRRSALAAIALLVAAAAGAWWAWWALVGSTRESTDNAYVGGNVVQVSPLVAGVVTRVRAEDTRLVRSGDELVTLDAADFEVQLARAEAALADAVRGVRALYANTAQARAALAGREADLQRARFEQAAAQAALERAQAELERREALAGRNFVSPENVQTARTLLQATRAQRDAAQAAVAQAETAIVAATEQLRATAGLVDRIPVAQHPRVLEAAAKVREADLALARTRIVAPVTGYVARRSVQVGQRVAPGTPLLAIVPAEQLWVDANFKESQLEHVRIGQPVTLRSDLYGGSVTFRGRVVGLGMGTGSAFALLPAQNATGNWIKIVQRVPVRIALEPAQLAEHPLRIGLSMQATVDTADRSGDVLERTRVDGPPLETTAFDGAATAADARIEAIIARNLGGPGQ